MNDVAEELGGGEEEFEAVLPGPFLAAYKVAYRVLGDVIEAEDAAAEGGYKTKYPGFVVS